MPFPRWIAPFAVLFLASSQNLLAQDLVYTPINPSFGGDPFYSNHLLGIAEINRPDPPRASNPFGSASDAGDSQADLFVRQLESRILSQLSADITDAIFGPNADPSGVFQFDDTTIAFETSLDGSIGIEIIDLSDGAVTEIQIPASLLQTNN